MWQICTGDEPHVGFRTTSKVFDAVVAGARPSLVAVEWCGQRFQQLLARAWHADPSERPSAMDLVDELRYVMLQGPSHSHCRLPFDASSAMVCDMTRSACICSHSVCLAVCIWAASWIHRAGRTGRRRGFRSQRSSPCTHGGKGPLTWFNEWLVLPRIFSACKLLASL